MELLSIFEKNVSRSMHLEETTFFFDEMTKLIKEKIRGPTKDMEKRIKDGKGVLIIILSRDFFSFLFFFFSFFFLVHLSCFSLSVYYNYRYACGCTSCWPFVLGS